MRWQEAEIRRTLPVWVIAAVAAAILFSALSTFGMWDPWELRFAEQARALTNPSGVAPGDRFAQLVALGFQWFGVSEWSGRLPNAMGGLATILLAYGFGAHFDKPRTGVYAAIAVGSTPLFLLNALSMIGHATAFAVQGALLFCSARALFDRALSSRSR